MILVDKFNFEYLPICAFNSNAGLCWSYDIRAWVSLNLLRSPHMSIFLSNQKRFVFDPNMRDTLIGPQSDSLCTILFFQTKKDSSLIQTCVIHLQGRSQILCAQYFSFEFLVAAPSAWPVMIIKIIEKVEHEV